MFNLTRVSHSTLMDLEVMTHGDLAYAIYKGYDTSGLEDNYLAVRAELERRDLTVRRLNAHCGVSDFDPWKMKND